MRILVLGGNGRFGRQLQKASLKVSKAADHCDQRECKLLFVSGKNIQKKLPSIEYLTCRDYDLELLKEIFEDFSPSHVFNLRVSYGDSNAQMQVNAIFPNELAKLCGQFDAKLVHFSSMAVVFDSPSGDYSRTKMLGEKYVQEFSHVIVLRISSFRSRKSFYYWAVKYVLLLRGLIKSRQLTHLKGPIDAASFACALMRDCGQTLDYMFGLKRSPINCISLDWQYLFQRRALLETQEELEYYVNRHAAAEQYCLKLGSEEIGVERLFNR